MVEVMSKDCLARWCCLLEGVNIIFDKAEELAEEDDDFSFLEDTKKFKAIHKALKNYIGERFHAMRYDLDCYLKEDKTHKDYIEGIFRS